MISTVLKGDALVPDRILLRKHALLFMWSGIIATIVTIVLVKLNSPKVVNLGEIKPMKMASNYRKSVRFLDPARITNLEEYELVRNLFGRLVEYDTNGELVPGIAASFRWQQNDLIFAFGSKARTASGQPITAQDAAFSLKRAVLMEKTGHGDIRTFLCSDHKLTSIDEACPGIRVEENELILTTTQSEYAPHLLALLGNADFSIIPRSSLSSDSKQPELVNFRETSGPYFVDQDREDGSWILKANPNHFLYSMEMPQIVELVPTTSQEAAKLFTSGDIDLVPTYLPLTGSDGANILNNRTDNSIHESMPIRVLMACFTPRAVRDFSPEQRQFIGQILEKHFLEKFPVPGGKSTVEFFQALSDGTLSNEQRQTLRERRKSSNRPIFKRPMQFGVIASGYELAKKSFADFPEIEIVKKDRSAYQLPLDERLDFYVVSSDAAWSESVSLLGHNFHIGIFHSPHLDGNKWVRDYASTPERERRIMKLSELHYDLLSSVVIYPIYVSPYYAAAHLPWHLQFSTFSAGTELWRIRQKR